MPLPEAIQRQADFADEYDKQVAAQAAPQAEPPKEVTEDSESAQTVQTQTTNPSESELEKYKARYGSLQGKYNSEVPALTTRNKELEARVQQLLDENSKLRETQIQREAEAEGLTAADETQYGHEMLNMVKRGIKQETAQQRLEIEQLKAQIQRQKAEAERARAEGQQQRDVQFAATMEKLVPGWVTQNEDQAFIQWLQYVDPVWGIQRQELLNQAAQSYDVQRVAAIFNLYRSETAQKQKDSPLAQQVSPTHTASANPPNTGATKWTSEKIAQFFEDARHGMYSPEEEERIENEIDAAVAAQQVLY